MTAAAHWENVYQTKQSTSVSWYQDSPGPSLDALIRLAIPSTAAATNSYLIIATFAHDGPEKCSNLPVARYDPSGLAKEIGPDFELVRDWRQEHTTPGGNQQLFNWCVFKRR